MEYSGRASPPPAPSSDAADISGRSVGRRVHAPKASFADLPDEIVAYIAAFLPQPDIKALCFGPHNRLWAAALQLYSPNFLRGGPDPRTALARVVEITGEDGVTPYQSELEQYEGAWMPSHVLLDEPPAVDEADYVTVRSGATGATWRCAGDTQKAGLLVVDMQKVRRISFFTIFQMYSDGKITHVQFLRHPCTDNRPPEARGGGWVAVAPEAEVPNPVDPVDGSDPPDASDQPLYRAALRLRVPEFSTRYLLIRARNDGRHGHPAYIEVRAIKAFRREVVRTPPTRVRLQPPPAPPGSNLLAGGPITLAPFAVVRRIGTLNDAAPYQTDLRQFDGSWGAPHALYDPDAATRHHPRQHGGQPSHGSTWRNTQPGLSVGCLLADLLTPRWLQFFTLFQMESDGRCTHVRLNSFPVLEQDEVPATTDDRWVPETDWLPLRAEPEAVAVALARPFCTRWLRVDCRNDGSFGAGGYIELHGIKGYAPESADYFHRCTAEHSACEL